MTFGSSAKSDDVYISALASTDTLSEGEGEWWRGRGLGKKRMNGTYHMIFLEES